MKMQIETVQTEIRDNAYESTPVFGWDWPDEAMLADLAEQNIRAEQDVRTEKDDRMEHADWTIENNSEYATLYFVS